MKLPPLTLWTGAACAFVLTQAHVNAQILFSEDFSQGLGQWTGKNGGGHNGVVVPDPLDSGRGDVLSFSGLNAAGDLFTQNELSPSGPIQIRFDYLGIPRQGGVDDDLGGFLGISPELDDGLWLAGTSTAYPSTLSLVDDGQWHKVALTVDEPFSPFRLMLEDWNGSEGVAGDVFFDNIEISAVPEPGDAACWTGLVLGGATLVAQVRRNRNLRQ